MDDSLDDLIGRCAKRSPAPLPGSFATDVLRAIRLRHRASQIRDDWFSRLTSMLFRPSLLAATLAIVVAIGVAIPAVLRSREAAMAATGLGLGIFSSASPDMPSGLLANL